MVREGGSDAPLDLGRLAPGRPVEDPGVLPTSVLSPGIGSLRLYRSGSGRMSVQVPEVLVWKHRESDVSQ